MFIYGVVYCIVFVFIERTLQLFTEFPIYLSRMRRLYWESTRIYVGIFDHEEKVTKI